MANLNIVAIISQMKQICLHKLTWTLEAWKKTIRLHKK